MALKLHLNHQGFGDVFVLEVEATGEDEDRGLAAVGAEVSTGEVELGEE